MDNKEQKTFADLFSSSTKDSTVSTEPKENTQTFSDIFNTKKEEPETSQTITFDSLFDKVPTLEETEKSAIDKPEQEKEISKPEGSHNEDEPASEVFYSNEESTKEDNENIKESEQDIFNPFLEVQSENKDEEIAENIEKETVQEEKQPEDEQKDNPFFESIDVSTNDLTATDEEKEEQNNEVEEELKFENNPFMNNEEIKTDEDKIVDDSNPFFIKEEEQSTSEESENKEELDIQINPFMDTTETIQEENIVDNSFLSNNEIIPNEEASNNETSILLDNEKEKKVSSEEGLIKSTSPFFEEEKKNEDNPFFQNQINLIENQTPNAPSGNIDTTKSKHYNVKIVKKKEPLIKFILGVLSYALFIWLLLIGITLLIYVLDIKIRAAKGDYSSPTFNAYVVLTGSMLPEIEVSDVVITKKVDAADLKEGDIITFASADSRLSGTIITHRIIKKNPKTDTEGYTFQTKGDNNNVADSALVPERNIYGKVILKIPKLGYLQEFLASDGGWIIVILIPCLVVISYDIVKLAKGLKRKKYKNIKVQK